MSLVHVARPWLHPAWLKPAYVWAGVLAMAPDADVLGFRFGIEYGDPLGHRGLSHALVAAAIIGALGVARLLLHVRKAESKPGARDALLLYVVLTLATASHGMLDMLTDGGLGVALWGPFSWRRLFWPVTPIPVSPIGLHPAVIPVLLWEATFFLPLFLGTWGMNGLRNVYGRALAAGFALAGTAGAFLYRLSF